MKRKFLSMTTVFVASTLALALLLLSLGNKIPTVYAAGPVVINELRIDQSGSTDPDEYFELVGLPGTSLDDLTYLVIGDGPGGSGVIEAVIPLTGTVIPADGFFLAVESTFTLTSTADLTTTINFENSDNVTHLLVQGFSGLDGDDLDTNDDGILDVTPWVAEYDRIALVEEANPPAATEYHYGPPEIGPDGSFVPGQVYRCRDAVGGWLIGSFTLGVDDTPGGANDCPPITINELRIDQGGSDNDEYFELAGQAGLSLNGLTYLVIGDDSGGSSGVIEAVVPLTGTVIPSDGYYLAVESTFSLTSTADLTTTINFENSDNVTHLLVGGFFGSDGDDLDINDDGVLDVTPWVAEYDRIALVEEANPPAATEYHYGPPEIGPDGSFVPGQAFRCPNASGTWNIGGFTLGADDTPGAENNCPELALSISKTAPTLVAPGELYTYTLTLTNTVGFTVNNVAITDVVPSNVQFASSISGTFNSGVVTWSLPSLADGSAIDITFAVTASGSLTNVTNSDYSVSAADFITPTAGAPVTTIVFDSGGLAIHDIQTATHVSPYDGQEVVAVRGIVTVLDSGSDYDGFYMQDDNPDADDATSEGIFVFTNGAPGVSVGDEVLVSGTVHEFRAVGFRNDFSIGPGAEDNLTLTRLVTPTVVISSSGNALPPAVIIGTDRTPPTEIIDNDSTGNVETGPTTFDPNQDGIDFYESLEGMLVQINGAEIVGARRSFGDIAILPNGVTATGDRTFNGGILLAENDPNPEVILLTDDINSTPSVNVGDSFTTPFTTVVDYNFDAYKFQPVSALSTAPGGLTAQTTSLTPTLDQLTIASFNVENLDPGDSKFNALADVIVDNLQSPDIIALQEVQDNNGSTDDGTVDADNTYNALITAISGTGGPTYQFRDIDPVDNQDGGEPGGNIRVGYLFNPSRVSFINRGSGGSTDAVTVTTTVTGAQLSLSPGRIDPTNSAFNGGRKSLAAEFNFNGNQVFVINNHLKSKSEDDPLFGLFQPPTLNTEAQRIAQAVVVNNFVDAILAEDADANIVVLGDMNEFQFREAISETLPGLDGALNTLLNLEAANEQYTYVFNGNSQILDHILVSDNLLNTASPEFDIVHVNADLDENSQPTDHEPIVARLNLPQVTLPGQINFMPNLFKDAAP